jgi:hypothetical protein
LRERKSVASVRGSQLKENVAALAWLGAERCAAVMRRVSPESIRQIEEASRVDWLPHALGVELAQKIREVAGEEAVRGWSRVAMNRALQGSLYRPFLEGLIAVFGPNPTAAWKVLPRSYAAAVKDCGEMRVLEAVVGRGQIVLVDLPVEAKDRDWLVSVAGGLEVVFDACKVKGRVELEFADPASDPLFHATWT